MSGGSRGRARGAGRRSHDAHAPRARRCACAAVLTLAAFPLALTASASARFITVTYSGTGSVQRDVVVHFTNGDCTNDHENVYSLRGSARWKSLALPIPRRVTVERFAVPSLSSFTGSFAIGAIGGPPDCPPTDTLPIPPCTGAVELVEKPITMTVKNHKTTVKHHGRRERVSDYAIAVEPYAAVHGTPGGEYPRGCGMFALNTALPNYRDPLDPLTPDANPLSTTIHYLPPSSNRAVTLPVALSRTLDCSVPSPSIASESCVVHVRWTGTLRVVIRDRPGF